MEPETTECRGGLLSKSVWAGDVRGERVCVVSGRGEVRDAEGVARVDGWTGNKQARVGWNGVLRLCRGAARGWVRVMRWRLLMDQGGVARAS